MPQDHEAIKNWIGELMTDPTSAPVPTPTPDQPVLGVSQPREKYYKNIEIPEGERAVIETFIAEHGIACLLDEAAQICDDFARRQSSTKKDYHIHSLLSLMLSEQVKLAEKIEHLQEG